ncbi:MAG: YraN family protein [Rhodospirillales bacterium]|nr:YraN family protein [Rhodospirillales bacterium]
MPRGRARLGLTPAAAPAAPAPARQARGKGAELAGRAAEEAACRWLAEARWDIFARRERTAAGEIDIAAERDGLVAIVEVKRRATLEAAAGSVSARQQARLLAAAELLLARHPQRGLAGVRFDVLLVDAGGQVRQIEDAFRLM